jgi:hypothetical protein
MASLEFFIGIILPWRRLRLQQKSVQGLFRGGYRRPVRRADNLGTSLSWNPLGLQQPCIGTALPLLLPMSKSDFLSSANVSVNNNAVTTYSTALI